MKPSNCVLVFIVAKNRIQVLLIRITSGKKVPWLRMRKILLVDCSVRRKRAIFQTILIRYSRCCYHNIIIESDTHSEVLQQVWRIGVRATPTSVFLQLLNIANMYPDCPSCMPNSVWMVVHLIQYHKKALHIILSILNFEYICSTTLRVHVHYCTTS